jgi:hypothetical protein
MDEIFLTEFRPPDDSMIEYVLNISALLARLSRNADLSDEDRLLAERSAHTVKVLLAMAVGGHILFESESTHADELADLSSSLYDQLFLVRPELVAEVNMEPLEKFRHYREHGPSVDIGDFPG